MFDDFATDRAIIISAVTFFEMEVNDQNLAVLRDLLQNTMSPITATRRQAEEMIKSTEAQGGFSLLLLTLISRLSVPASPDDIAVRQSASVYFKNLVKKRWAPEDDTEAPISNADRDALKTVVINMMSTSPPDVQKLLSEGISIIAKYDFPAKWGNLLPELVSQLNTPDLTMLKGVMLTANSIMKRFRDACKSDELFAVLLLCLTSFAEPLTIKYAQVATAIEQSANDKQQLITLLEIQRLMSRVFYSLNWLDIPEYFEDNLAKWAELFAKFLQYSNPLVIDAGEDKEPGQIESLQTAILDNLNLYATKYEDVFQPYLELFTQLVWKRLMEIGPEPKYDIIATSAIRFLTSVCSKDVNRGLFSDAVLKDIVQHIIVRNLMATEADEELFEDNPIDYIHKDMEGSDQDTRRRSAMEFVRALMKFFPQQVSLLCVDYINVMLESYRISRDWKAKDAAMHLILCVAVKSGTVATGASEINPLIDVLGIFSTHVLPEIHDTNVNGSSAPIIKADALKLICVFRSQFDAPFMLSLLEHVLRYLTAKNVVIQTYAVLCIERFLSVKDKNGAVAQPRINKQALAPFFQPLFGGLFNALVNPSLGENEYVMKCIMRALLVVGSDITPVTELVVQHLTSALEKACKNPVNPHYNHYLFESLALLIRASCGNGSGEISPAMVASCSHFETLLFPPLEMVLVQDISEFVPYCFQILAQLLGARPANSGLTDAYRGLFVPMLVPAVWEQKGNIPALVDLFKSYISRGMGEIIAGNFLEGVLGIFQKLIAAKVSLFIHYLRVSMFP